MILSVEWQMVSFGVQQSRTGMHDLDEESNMLVRKLGSDFISRKGVTSQKILVSINMTVRNSDLVRQFLHLQMCLKAYLIAFDMFFS